MSAELARGQLPPFALIIPARYGSRRFPGKPLASLRGAEGDAKPLIQRSWECAKAIPGAVGVWVATDDLSIAATVEDFGGQVVLTSAECRNGTERCAEALGILGPVADLVVNLQGDAPLTPGFVVQQTVAALAGNPNAAMATPGVACSPSVYRHLVDDQTAGRIGGTTVVANQRGRALYFSKRVLPFLPSEEAHRAPQTVRLHLGVYAYRAAALAEYATIAPSLLETVEGLEQLRFLEMDQPIQVVPFEPLAWDCIELNNPEDVPVIEAILAARGIN